MQLNGNDLRAVHLEDRKRRLGHLIDRSAIAHLLHSESARRGERPTAIVVSAFSVRTDPSDALRLVVACMSKPSPLGRAGGPGGAARGMSAVTLMADAPRPVTGTVSNVPRAAHLLAFDPCRRVNPQH
jgi:hypothetical protein